MPARRTGRQGLCGGSSERYEGPRTGLRGPTAHFPSSAWGRPLAPDTRLLALLFLKPSPAALAGPRSALSPLPSPSSLLPSPSFSPSPTALPQSLKTRRQEDSIRPQLLENPRPVPSWPWGSHQSRPEQTDPLLRLGQVWPEREEIREELNAGSSVHQYTGRVGFTRRGRRIERREFSHMPHPSGAFLTPLCPSSS